MKTTELYLHRRPSANEVDLEVYAKGVMKTFFEDYELEMSHGMLWTMMKGAFVGEESTLSSVESKDLVSYYERVHELIIAGSILYSGWEDIR